MPRKLFSLFGEIILGGVEKTTKEMKAINKQAANMKRSLNKVAKQAKAVGTALTKYVTVPLLAAAAAATKFGSDFEAAMTDSLAIMGDVSSEMRKDMEAVARTVSKDLNISATKTAEAYFFLASAGLDAAQSMAALPDVAKFAKAGNFDLAVATDLLTDSQSALGLQSKDTATHMENMAMISDVLVKANTLANGSVQQFAESLTNRAGAALRMLKKDVTEGVAVLAVYADQGEKGAEAGTKLDIVFRDLQKAAINNKAAFESIGLSVFDADGKMRHIADIVEDLTNHMGGLSDEQKRAELMTLGFTDKSVAATTALLGTSDAIREYEAELKIASGTTNEVAQKRLKSFKEQLGLVKRELLDVGITIFQKLKPALMLMIGLIRGVMEWFSNLPGVVKDFGVALIATAAVLGPMVLAFSKLALILKAAIPLYVALVAKQGLLNAVMATNPIALVVAAIAALVAAGYVLVKNWEHIAKWFGKIWGGISHMFTMIITNMQILYKAGILTIIKGLQKLGKFLPGIAGKLKELRKETESDIEALKRHKEILKENNDARVDGLNKSTQATKDYTKAAKDAREEEERAANFSRAARGQTMSYEKLLEKTAKKKKVRTAEEIAADKKKYEEKVQFEKKWLDKLAEATNSQSELIDRAEKEALESATKFGASTTSIQAFYAKQRADLSKKEADIKREHEEQWKDNISSLSADRIQIIEMERDKAIKAAEEKNLSTYHIEKFYAKRIKKEHEKIDDERRKIEEEWNKKLSSYTMTKIDLLEMERDKAIEIAKEKGASVYDIEKFYAIKIGEERLRISQETSQKIQESLKKQLFGEFRAQVQHTKGLKEQKEIAVENAKLLGQDELLVAQSYDQKIKDSRVSTVKAGIETTVGYISNGVSMINSIWQASLNKRLTEIEEERAARIAEVNALLTTEEEKQTAIDEINKEADAKKLELQKENAIREKANSIFSIGLSTAMGVASALTIPPPAGIILAGIVGALGAVQLGIAAATPIPFKEGALIKSDPGRGVIGQIGEGQEDELIFPMKTGVAQLAENLMSKIGANGGGMNGATRAIANEYHSHYHIGALIADSQGLKMLEKKMRPYRVSEAQRRGA